MRAGSPFLFDLALYDADGVGLSYANAAAFESAGWSAVAVSLSTGIDLSPAVAYTLAPVAGIDGRHSFRYTLTDTPFFWRFTGPTTSHVFNVIPGAINDGEVNDPDTLYARFNSVYGLTTATTVPGVIMNSMVEGDSYFTTITIPTSYLARMGWTDLTGTTLDGTIRVPGDHTIGTPAVALVMGTNLAINGDNAAAIDIYWDTYPPGMVLTPDMRAEGQAVFTVEVQAKMAGKTLTILYNAPLTVFHQDDAA